MLHGSVGVDRRRSNSRASGFALWLSTAVRCTAAIFPESEVDRTRHGRHENGAHDPKATFDALRRAASIDNMPVSIRRDARGKSETSFLSGGPKFVALYNDAYAPTIGAKRPRALGRPPRESWTELWDYLEPLLRRVLDTGETIFAKDRPFNIERWHRRPTSPAPARKARTDCPRTS
jgi:hypothetical protein